MSSGEMFSIWFGELVKAIKPMYIFTVLAFLLGATLFTITHTPDIKDAVAALMNIIAGGLLALIGTVVNYEFGASKPREPLKAPPGTTVESTTTINTATPPAAQTEVGK